MDEIEHSTIQRHAHKLASKAAYVPICYSVGTAIVCVLIGYSAGVIAGENGAANSYSLLLGELAAGGIAGYRIGMHKAVSLSLQAQITLCQLKVGNDMDQQMSKDA